MALDEYNKELNRLIFGIKEETAVECIDIGCENCEVIDKIRAEIIQSIQNGALKIESGNEELFRIIDKYRGE